MEIKRDFRMLAEDNGAENSMLRVKRRTGQKQRNHLQRRFLQIFAKCVVCPGIPCTQPDKEKTLFKDSCQGQAYDL